LHRISLTLAPLLLTAAAAAQATPTVDQPWTRATAGGGTTGAAYLTLTAHDQGDRLTGASTPVADMAELHQSSEDHGVMRMRPVEGLALEPGKPVALSPGGMHLMLMGLKQPLKQGASFPLTLTFEHAPPVTVQVPVKAAGAARP